MCVKTRIAIKDFLPHNLSPVSRSQAKRITKQLTGFNEVTLDFSDIAYIGQAFAHELFVKFPKIAKTEVLATNQNKQVQDMIQRVKHTR